MKNILSHAREVGSPLKAPAWTDTPRPFSPLKYFHIPKGFGLLQPTPQPTLRLDRLQYRPPILVRDNILGNKNLVYFGSKILI